AQGPARHVSGRSNRAATAARPAPFLDQCRRAKKRVSWARWRAGEGMAAAAWAAQRRPRWQTKAATKGTSRPREAALRQAGRRNVLIVGRASAKIPGGLRARQQGVGVHRYGPGRPGRREGVSFLVHDATRTNVERNFRAPASGERGWG